MIHTSVITVHIYVDTADRSCNHARLLITGTSALDTESQTRGLHHDHMRSNEGRGKAIRA